MSLLEAMAAGLPCLSVNCQSGPAEVIESGVNGLLVPQDDPRALAEALRRLMSEPDLRQRLGAAAPAIQERFGWDAFVAAHLRVLAAYERRSSGQNRLPSERPDATL